MPTEQDLKQPNLVNAKNNKTKSILIAVGAVVVLLALLLGGSAVYNKLYNRKVLSRVYIGQHHLGGLTEAEIIDMLENFNNRIAKESLDFTFSAQGRSASGGCYFQLLYQ